MKNPKVGERICFYYCDSYSLKSVRGTGNIEGIHKDGTIYVRDYKMNLLYVHPKQCRRLEIKRKPMEFYILPYGGPARIFTIKHFAEEEASFSGRKLYHVREILETKK